MTIAIGHMADDEREPVIHLSHAERMGIQNADAALEILIPRARSCYHVLQASCPELDDRNRFVHFIHMSDCAMQVVQQQNHVGLVDTYATSIQIDLPGIVTTLPLLVEGYQDCRPLWKVSHKRNYLTYTHSLLTMIGWKIYPDIGDDLVWSGYGDIFAGDS